MIAILARKYLPLQNLGLNSSKRHYLTVSLFYLFSSVDLDLLSFLTVELYEEPELCNVVIVL